MILNDIIKKTFNGDDSSIINIIYNQTRFNLGVLYHDHPEFCSVIGSGGKDKRFRNNIFEKINIFTENKSSDHDIEVFGFTENKRCIRYISSKYVEMNHENVTTWKVLIPAANGSSPIGGSTQTPIIGPPVIAAPFTGYTQTFIGLGSFQNRDEAEAALKYVKSKFARCLLGVLKITQHNPPATWKYVPLQDFTASSDIDWSASIAEIDAQLYRKYGLSESEIAFVESNVKEMN